MYPLNSKQNSEKSERREVAVTPKIEKKKKRPYRADNGIKTIITSFGVTKYTVVLKPCLRAPKACSGTTQRDRVRREVGGVFRMGRTHVYLRPIHFDVQQKTITIM